jgi:hypothetical protein
MNILLENPSATKINALFVIDILQSGIQPFVDQLRTARDQGQVSTAFFYMAVLESYLGLKSDFCAGSQLELLCPELHEALKNRRDETETLINDCHVEVYGAPAVWFAADSTEAAA